MKFDVLACDGQKEVRRYCTGDTCKMAVIHFFGRGTEAEIVTKERELLGWIKRMGAFNILPGGARVRRLATTLLPFLHHFEIEVDLTDAIVGF